MRKPCNDYIVALRLSSTFLGRLSYANQLASPLDFLTPLPREQDPPT